MKQYHFNSNSGNYPTGYEDYAADYEEDEEEEVIEDMDKVILDCGENVFEVYLDYQDGNIRRLTDNSGNTCDFDKEGNYITNKS